MKKLMNLNKRAAIKTKLIVFAIVLSAIITYADGQTNSVDPLGHTAGKYVMAQPQPAAAHWDNGTSLNQKMPVEKRVQINTNTQKAMKNAEIAVKQSQQAQMKPALPLTQKDSTAKAQVQTPVIKQESTEPNTQAAESNAGSEKAGLTSTNNLLYIGILLILLLAAFLFLQGRKGKNKGPSNEKVKKKD